MINSNNPFTIEEFTKTGIDTARLLLDAVDNLTLSTVRTPPSLNAVFERSSTCKIPPPCWLPRSLGEYSSKACPCGTALIRLRVTNCNPTSSQLSIKSQFDAETPDINVKITPESATLEPMERRWFTVSVSLPEDACVGHSHELLLWVSGCNNYYLRWIVHVANDHSGSCHEVTLEDCPDHIHHWYDHFYCARSCLVKTSGSVADERKLKR